MGHPWWANEKGWWRCDHCGEPINPKWKRGTPTPELPMRGTNGRILNWVHRACYELLTAKVA
jgi:hypothetical protein